MKYAIIALILLFACAPTAETCNGMSYQEAQQIAKTGDCAQGTLKTTHFCNEGTNTWWIDLNLEKQGCSPACVIDATTKKAEINWRCTGLIATEDTPDNAKTHMQNIISIHDKLINDMVATTADIDKTFQLKSPSDVQRALWEIERSKTKNSRIQTDIKDIDEELSIASELEMPEDYKAFFEKASESSKKYAFALNLTKQINDKSETMLKYYQSYLEFNKKLDDFRKNIELVDKHLEIGEYPKALSLLSSMKQEAEQLTKAWQETESILNHETSKKADDLIQSANQYTESMVLAINYARKGMTATAEKELKKAELYKKLVYETYLEPEDESMQNIILNSILPTTALIEDTLMEADQLFGEALAQYDKIAQQ